MKSLVKIIPVIFLFAACAGGKATDETPTRGNIRISVDESFRPMIEAEIFTFQSLYEDAKINAKYKPEWDCIADLMNDSVRLAIVGRTLTPDEEKQLNSASYFPKTTKIAYDAIALIVNNNNKDTMIRYDQVQGLFTGKITKWQQISNSNNTNDIVVVFDNTKSANVRYIKEKFDIKKNFPKNCFAVNNNAEVINFVEKNPNTIGVISVNWISDKDDTLSNSFLRKVKVVEIGEEGDTAGYGSFCRPFQGYIADCSYPLRREVYIISREPFAGLGTGFASFVAGEKGQRIILKSGIVPATMPIRLIEVKRK